MDVEDRALDAFISNVEVKQKRLSVALITLSVISVTVGLSLLAYSVMQVKKKLEQVRILEKRLEETEAQLNDAKSRLREATDLGKDVVPLDLEFPKGVATTNRQAYRVFRPILDNREIEWRLGGRSPSEGFDSPAYAAYILGELGPGYEQFSDLLRQGQLNIREELLRRMECVPAVRQSSPQEGDLIFYRSGFVMFYFEDHGAEFVIGMTTQGVVPLRIDFAPRETICHLPLTR